MGWIGKGVLLISFRYVSVVLCRGILVALISCVVYRKWKGRVCKETTAFLISCVLYTEGKVKKRWNHTQEMENGCID